MATITSKFLLQEQQVTYQQQNLSSYVATCTSHPIWKPLVSYTPPRSVLGAEESASLVQSIILVTINPPTSQLSPSAPCITILCPQKHLSFWWPSSAAKHMPLCLTVSFCQNELLFWVAEDLIFLLSRYVVFFSAYKMRSRTFPGGQPATGFLYFMKSADVIHCYYWFNGVFNSC